MSSHWLQRVPVHGRYEPPRVGVCGGEWSVPLPLSLQAKQMKFKDSRIKLMSEILGGIKVLKLYAWEPSLLQQVEGIRQSELRLLRRAAYLLVISIFSWSCTPFLVRLSCRGWPPTSHLGSLGLWAQHTPP